MGRTSRTTKGGRMKRLSDNAIEIVNELHTERLDYESEYVPIIDALNRLAEYEDMEEQGLLLKLPCKMGDKLWIIVTKRPRVYSPEFSFVKASKLTWNNLQQVLKGLKKTVFTSREEAEKALEEEA